MDARVRLERAAADVIVILKGIAEYSEASIAVIGGLALWKYIQGGRGTQDVDFIISIDSAPHSVKNKLLALPNSPFIQQAQYFLYEDREGNYVQIDITPAWQSEDWWRQRLGLPAQVPPADDYWTWSDEYQNWYHMDDDGTCEWASPGESSTGPSQKPKKPSKSKSKGSRR
ncbi:hypothetical protein NKR19_g3245 [Coniochaeta hoffmannii]|uniref:Uncharacterized protein n=1 Tax=Coniochaeta hoffmannii TaxID=91930 RepID=A0AA38RWG3_9PEZI|nr:hypothetical protein NKR19_g3245 [Coniochaeta hoffmannii]